MKNGYRRRSDAGDMSFEWKLGIAIWELENVAETADERAALQGEIDRLKVVIEERKPRLAPEGGMLANPNHDFYQGGPTKRF